MEGLDEVLLLEPVVAPEMGERTEGSFCRKYLDHQGVEEIEGWRNVEVENRKIEGERERER